MSPEEKQDWLDKENRDMYTGYHPEDQEMIHNKPLQIITPSHQTSEEKLCA